MIYKSLIHKLVFIKKFLLKAKINDLDYALKFYTPFYHLDHLKQSFDEDLAKYLAKYQSTNYYNYKKFLKSKCDIDLKMYNQKIYVPDKYHGRMSNNLLLIDHSAWNIFDYSTAQDMTIRAVPFFVSAFNFFQLFFEKRITSEYKLSFNVDVNSLGTYSYENKEIVINNVNATSDITDNDLIKDTVFHELFHYFLKESDINLNEDIEEGFALFVGQQFSFDQDYYDYCVDTLIKKTTHDESLLDEQDQYILDFILINYLIHHALALRTYTIKTKY